MTTEQRSLDQVAPELGEAYVSWKEREVEKNVLKDEFFELADEHWRREGLALKLYEVEATSETQAWQRAELHNPGWLVDELRPHLTIARRYEVILCEDANYKPFSFEAEGVKYARSVSRGAVMIDDEWLQEGDPELYQAVTYELPWGVRIPVPVDRLDKQILGRLQKYLYSAKPTVRLAKPQPVKSEE